MFGIFEQPSIFIYGVEISEPITTLTDLVVSAICFYAFYKLSKIPYNKNRKTHIYLKYYFLSMGFATLIGGVVGHGFFYLFTFAWKLPGWLTSMFSIALLERAVIYYARNIINPKIGKFLSWLNVIELLTFMTLTFYSLNFFFVEVHSAYGLLFIVASLSIYVYSKTKSYGSKILIIAIVFSSISALFFMNQWGLCKWFNHFDISHSFMAISAYVFYLGAKKIISEPISKIK